MTKFNNRNFTEPCKLTSIKTNFIGCQFILNSISTNIPDKWATTYKDTLNNEFLISGKMNKILGGYRQFISNFTIIIYTNKSHNIQDDIKEIIQDIQKQDIFIERYKKSYEVEGNNYSLEI